MKLLELLEILTCESVLIKNTYGDILAETTKYKDVVEYLSFDVLSIEVIPAQPVEITLK